MHCMYHAYLNLMICIHLHFFLSKESCFHFLDIFFVHSKEGLRWKFPTFLIAIGL
jgi:hypothetical protein